MRSPLRSSHNVNVSEKSVSSMSNYSPNKIVSPRRLETKFVPEQLTQTKKLAKLESLVTKGGVSSPQKGEPRSALKKSNLNRLNINIAPLDPLQAKSTESATKIRVGGLGNKLRKNVFGSNMSLAMSSDVDDSISQSESKKVELQQQQKRIIDPISSIIEEGKEGAERDEDSEQGFIIRNVPIERKLDELN